MNLGTKARYAVMAMVDLGAQEGDKPVKLAEIATRQEIPLAYLEQIFARLKQHGLVKSVKGPGGGYKLARAQAETPISDIVVAVDESMKMTRCESHSHEGCMATKARCLTHDLWDGLSKQIYKYFSAISLEDVCSRKRDGKKVDFSPSFEDTKALQGQRAAH
jgi:Rrf2 family transcriptional regulator, iron-sulfur cluster assembly transcription factor